MAAQFIDELVSGLKTKARIGHCKTLNKAMEFATLMERYFLEKKKEQKGKTPIVYPQQQQD